MKHIRGEGKKYRCGQQSATPDTGAYESNSEIDVTEEPEGEGGAGNPEYGEVAGAKQKHVPSKLVIKAARARRLRQEAVNSWAY